jgi:hypothetical protein
MNSSENPNTRLHELFPTADWREPELLMLTHGGKAMPVAKCFLRFKLWTGEPISSDLRKEYGKKPVVDCKGRAAFAELAILDLLRLAKSAKFDGRWVDNWRNRFWKSPWVEDPLPLHAQAFYRRIVEARDGRRGGFWDVFAWNDGQYVFVESKRRKKDRITRKQREWLRVVQNINEVNSCSSFLICEWDFEADDQE